MLGDTLTLTDGGSGGTAFVLKKIREQDYSSEYFLTSGSDPVIRHTATVRHSVDSVKAGQPAMDRHSIRFLMEWTDSDTKLPRAREVQLTIRGQPDDVPADLSNLAEALTYWASETNLLKVIGWES